MKKIWNWVLSNINKETIEKFLFESEVGRGILSAILEKIRKALVKVAQSRIKHEHVRLNVISFLNSFTLDEILKNTK